LSNNEHTDQQPASLVNPVSEYTSTDSIQEMKSGIFSIFVSLYKHMSVNVGPTEAMKYCILYLQEIINHFQEILDDETNNKPNNL